MLPLSARSPQALKALAQSYQSYLAAGREETLQDIFYTASQRRTHHDHRLSLVGNSKEELAKGLQTFVEEGSAPGLSSGRRIPGHRPKTVFVFSGQGSQWIGMGRELWEQEPVYREALEQCDRAMRRYVDWSLIEELEADEPPTWTRSCDQPAIFAIQVSWLRSGVHGGLTR
jgi:acyl transferase domain-containing protein